jgi:hypothetical protein
MLYLNTQSRREVIYHWLIMLIMEKNTRFRISCRQHIIEKGRYKKIPAYLRICQHCNAIDIGAEMHFLQFCNKFNKDGKI